MDLTWVIPRIGVGGGIWTGANMAKVAATGVTHIIDMQVEFDDTPLAYPYGIEVFWNRVDDDFQPKPAEVFQPAIEFALGALENPDHKLLIHCAAGVHRAPMMALALLRVQGWELQEAMELMEDKRPVVDFADVYVRSVEDFIRNYASAGKR